jgi:hypothetical protein
MVELNVVVRHRFSEQMYTIVFNVHGVDLDEVAFSVEG